MVWWLNLSLTMLLVDQTVLVEFQSQTLKKIWPVLQYSFWFTSQKMCGAFILSNYSFQFTWELKETWEKKKEWNWTNGFMWSHGKDFEIIIKFFLNKWYRFTLHLMLFLKKSFTYCVWEKKSHEDMGLIWMLPFYLFFLQTYGDLVTKTAFL